ncbi:MAG: DUF4164 family protein [Asticcacaulis sp.]
MENSGPIGSNLSVAVDRLDRALATLEARLQGLQDGERFAAVPPEVTEEYQRMQAELAEVRAREQQLAQAAHGAFEALGMAAANIRILLRDEAA